MSDTNLYEIVQVLSSPTAAALGVSDNRGIVVGISGEAEEKKYAVLVGSRTLSIP